MTWRDRLLLTVYPELRDCPSRERRAALKRAREGGFDTLESIGLLVSVSLVAALTRYASAGLRPIEILGIAGTNFFVALGLLLLFGGPFLLRRTRRHLASALRDRAPDRGA